MKRISSLHCITWDHSGRSHLDQVRTLIQAGADWIQLRQKQGSVQEKLEIARETARLCRDAGTTLIINDDPFLCKECGASGVHLGLQDMPVSEARILLGEQAVIGGTANTPEQALQRFREGCDYIGLGPWRYTGTKENLSPVLGVAGVRKVIEALRSEQAKIPVIVIGGIVPEDIPEILALGAHGVAMSSVLSADSRLVSASQDKLRKLSRPPV
jgi:thiamine-phosphate pyrophosphorylase